MLSVLTFRTPEEAVEKANNTPYGLSAGVWTEKGSRILWMADRLRAGVVWANTYNRFDPASPFGGYKESGLRPRGRPARARAVPRLSRRRRRMSRLPVRKTYKLFIGGAFPRSESGRTYLAEGQNVARASRKDARDAVRAARWRRAKWAGMTAYNRGQVLYRLAEMMETRSAELAELCSGDGEVARSIDRVVWYAGWADKLAAGGRQLEPGRRAVLQLHAPEPTGVVAVIAPPEPALEGLVSRIAPVLVGGNAVVAVASEDASAGRDRARRGDRDLRRPRWRREHPHRPPVGARADPRRAHGRERARPERHGRRLAPSSRCSPPRT